MMYENDYAWLLFIVCVVEKVDFFCTIFVEKVYPYWHFPSFVIASSINKKKLNLAIWIQAKGLFSWFYESNVESIIL